MMDCSGCKSVAIIDGSTHCAAPSCPRHIEHMDEAKQQLTAEREARQRAETDEVAELQRENAELTRKLAEQRMEINLLDEIGKLLADYEYKGSYADAVRNLLEEAKRQTVQEDNLYNQAYRNHVARMSPDLDLEADRIASKVILSAAPQPHKD